MKKNKVIVSALLAAVCALVMLFGAVSVQAALDRTSQSFTSDKYNAITLCRYELTSGRAHTGSASGTGTALSCVCRLRSPTGS